jgi:hypothetical protein
VSEQAKKDTKRLVGSWLHVGTFADGKPVPGRGAKPTGIIMYDVHGYMSCHVAPDREVTKAGKETTPEEAKAALDGYIAYFGTYSVDEAARTVTHHRHGSVQPGDKADLVRGYEFVDDRLILRPIGSKAEVIWERIK